MYFMPWQIIMVTTLSFESSFQCVSNRTRVMLSLCFTAAAAAVARKHFHIICMYFYTLGDKHIFVCSISLMQVYLQCNIYTVACWLTRSLVIIHSHMWILNLTPTSNTDHVGAEDGNHDDDEEKEWLDKVMFTYQLWSICWMGGKNVKFLPRALSLPFPSTTSSVRINNFFMSDFQLWH